MSILSQNNKLKQYKYVMFGTIWVGFFGVSYWSYHILDFEMWLFILNNIKWDECWFPTIIHDNL